MLNFAKTDVGKVRKMNQDYYYISEDETLYILADGMGGYTGGEIASKLATIAAVKYINEHFNKNNDYEKEEILEIIYNAIEYANKEVYKKAQSNEELDQMGTTIEVCLIYRNRAYLGHVGDSRIYRIRKGIMRKITTDHSYVQTLVEDGTITKEEAEHHPKKNMLVKAMGCEGNVNADVMVKGFQKDDIILICSDGLTNMISEEEILSIINNDTEKAADILINKANENGGLDNITLIIIKNNLEV